MVPIKMDLLVVLRNRRSEERRSRSRRDIPWINSFRIDRGPPDVAIIGPRRARTSDKSANRSILCSR